MKFDAIIIFVQNIDRLRPFYVDGLGFVVVEDQPPGWLLLEMGEFKIGLHRIGEEYLIDSKKEVKFYNNTKLVFEVFEEIEEVRSKLIAMDIEMGVIKTFDNYDFWVCDGADPEGNVFQLKKRKR